jgi:hypothetical protein
VKIPPDRRKFVGERFNLVDRGHGHTRLVEGSGKEVASTTAPARATAESRPGLLDQGLKRGSREGRAPAGENSVKSRI